MIAYLKTVTDKQIVAAEARITKNTNFSDVFMLTFDETSTSGMVFIQERGVWTVEKAEHSWRGMLGLDLFPSFTDDNFTQLKFSALK